MNYTPIPEGSIEVQTGLWAWLDTFTFGNITRSHYIVYSAEGYCFYNLQVPENFDENGNLVPPENRLYATYASTACTTVEQINAILVSVPYEEGYEVVSVPNEPEQEVV